MRALIPRNESNDFFYVILALDAVKNVGMKVGKKDKIQF